LGSVVRAELDDVEDRQDEQGDGKDSPRLDFFRNTS
jgi:hypothetical protein